MLHNNATKVIRILHEYEVLKKTEFNGNLCLHCMYVLMKMYVCARLYIDVALLLIEHTHT